MVRLVTVDMDPFFDGATYTSAVVPSCFLPEAVDHSSQDRKAEPHLGALGVILQYAREKCNNLEKSVSHLTPVYFHPIADVASFCLFHFVSLVSAACFSSSKPQAPPFLPEEKIPVLSIQICIFNP